MTDRSIENPGPPDDPWMTLTEIGEEFKVHPETVRLWIRGRQLEGKRAGRKWIVKRSVILEFIRSRTGAEGAADPQVASAVPMASSEAGREPMRPPTSEGRLTDLRAGVSERVHG
jgi:hypothetical protein